MLSLVNPASAKVVVGDLEYCCYVVMWPLPGPPRSPAPPRAAPSDAALSLSGSILSNTANFDS